MSYGEMVTAEVFCCCCCCDGGETGCDDDDGAAADPDPDFPARLASAAGDGGDGDECSLLAVGATRPLEAVLLLSPLLLSLATEEEVLLADFALPPLPPRQWQYENPEKKQTEHWMSTSPSLLRSKVEVDMEDAELEDEGGVVDRERCTIITSQPHSRRNAAHFAKSQIDPQHSKDTQSNTIKVK